MELNAKLTLTITKHGFVMYIKHKHDTKYKHGTNNRKYCSFAAQSLIMTKNLKDKRYHQYVKAAYCVRTGVIFCPNQDTTAINYRSS